MSKNIVVLSMSTLNITNGVINPENFIYEGMDNPKGEEYCSQLEPISKMIKEREGSLDKVIILATKEAREDKEFICKEEHYSTSAVGFYKKRLDLKDENPGISSIIEINSTKDEKDIVNSINGVISEVRNAFKDWENDDPKLWVDTQGGGREINLMMNAIISLLSSENIVPEGIYAVDYIRGRETQEITDKTGIYDVFNFVSGINAFSSYGRADQLSAYYENKNKTKSGEYEVVQAMKEVTECIQLCNVSGFKDKLEEFRKKWNEFKTCSEQGLLGIFKAKIEDDYGNLLKEDKCDLDIIKWLWDKGFYQQALTYIESQMPDYWFKKKLWDYEIIDERIFYAAKPDWKNDIVHGFDKLIDIIKEKTDDKFCNFKWNEIKSVKDVKRMLSAGDINFKSPEAKDDEVRLWILTSEKDLFIQEVFLYKMLKGQRNVFNHMVDSESVASKEAIECAIKVFIDYGKEIESAKIIENKEKSANLGMNSKKKSTSNLIINFTKIPDKKWSKSEKDAAKKYGTEISKQEIRTTLKRKQIEDDIENYAEDIFEKNPRAIIVADEDLNQYTRAVFTRLKEKGVIVLIAEGKKDEVFKADDPRIQQITTFTFEKFKEF